ncbi:hypothetical protein TorRG33x02_151560 [Trema orientale]|uniref:Uncharacterized protein n=1 Tax=Trema orientale TaxID=63057 RepID=A0A2P5EU59_TREOI|nr:hypothetical protein TorRG33x02_151560 [Trema orientale]
MVYEQVKDAGVISERYWSERNTAQEEIEQQTKGANEQENLFQEEKQAKKWFENRLRARIAGLEFGFHELKDIVIAQYPDLDWSFLGSTLTPILDTEDLTRANPSYPAELPVTEAD